MTGKDLTVTTAGSEDVGGVIALIGRVFTEYGFVFDAAVEVPDLLAFASHYAPPHGAFYVVRKGATVLGSVGVERLDGETAELPRLYLDGEWRGGGLRPRPPGGGRGSGPGGGGPAAPRRLARP